MKYFSLFLLSTFLLSSCATIVNDPTVPITFSFSDGSEGTCKVYNKRINMTVSIPGTHQIRRSDDNLQFNCKSENGKTGFGSIPSTMGAKIVASAVFIDLGIVDAITDKHRNYPASFIIPVK